MHQAADLSRFRGRHPRASHGHADDGGWITDHPWSVVNQGYLDNLKRPLRRTAEQLSRSYLGDPHASSWHDAAGPSYLPARSARGSPLILELIGAAAQQSAAGAASPATPNRYLSLNRPAGTTISVHSTAWPAR